jgi:hypothetical protein
MILYVAVKVPTAMVMKSYVFWDIMQCSPLKANSPFGGTYLSFLR